MAESEVTHSIASAAEDGVSTGGNAVWSDSLNSITAGTTDRAGFRFTTLPFTAVGDGLTDRYYRTLVLTLPVAVVPSGSGALVVYAVDEVAPAAFSSSRIPGAGTLTEVAVATVEDPSTGTLSISLDMNIMSGAFTNGTSLLNPYHKNGFQGALALTVGWTSAGSNISFGMVGSAVPATETTLVATGVPFHSGISGVDPVGSRGFIDEKTGQITTEDKVNNDGYYTRMRVLPENYDPPEPPRRPRRPQPRRFTIPSGTGEH